MNKNKPLINNIKSKFKFVFKASGLTLASALFSASIGGASAAAEGVEISEFMPNPINITDANGEWVELYNSSDAAVNISGWKLRAGGNITMPVDAEIVAYGYYVVCKTDDATEVCDYSSSAMSLNNTSAVISIVDDAEQVVDSIEYFEADVSEGNSTYVATTSDMMPGEPEEIIVRDTENPYTTGDGQTGNTGTPGAQNQGEIRANDDKLNVEFSNDGSGNTNLDVISNDNISDDYYSEVKTSSEQGAQLAVVAVDGVDGYINYQNKPGFYGTDNFDYLVCLTESANASCSSAGVAVLVATPNIVLKPAEFKTDYQTALSEDLGSLVESSKNALYARAAMPTATAQGGTVEFSEGFMFSYTPADGFSGEDEFSYKACINLTTVCAENIVKITVADAPVDPTDPTDPDPDPSEPTDTTDPTDSSDKDNDGNVLGTSTDDSNAETSSESKTIKTAQILQKTGTNLATLTTLLGFIVALSGATLHKKNIRKYEIKCCCGFLEAIF